MSITDTIRNVMPINMLTDAIGLTEKAGNTRDPEKAARIAVLRQKQDDLKKFDFGDVVKTAFGLNPLLDIGENLAYQSTQREINALT